MAEKNEALVVQQEETVDVAAPSALDSWNRSEIMQQIEVARRFPRSIATFRHQVKTLATMDETVAASCFYSLPPRGEERKTIQGPSVRLAEIAAQCYQHLRINTFDLDVEERVVRAQSVAWDLQNNVAFGIQATRRITRRDGSRYGDDMINTTRAACRSVAFRDVVWKVVPFAHVKETYDECRQIALGKGQTMEQRRARVVETYAKLGLRPAQVCAIVGRKEPTEITEEDLIALFGLHTAIREGDTTIEQIMAGITSGPTVVGGLALADIAQGAVVQPPPKEGEPDLFGEKGEKPTKYGLRR